MNKLDDLVTMTQSMKQVFRDADLVPIDNSAPEAVRNNGAFTWKEECFYNTLLGELPEPGIWSIGRTKEESWRLFDRQFKLRLQPDGTLRSLNKRELEDISMPEFDMNSFLKNCKEYQQWKNRHGSNEHA